ncbi:MAG: IclR family transcriptional regulator [Spirochaetales bacterium]|nr:IclR family transcriptional regulator [Spirochaetales bacterium]
MKVQSLSRTFDILELLSKEQQGLSLTDISTNVDLHKSTVYRLLSSLMERGYIEKRETKYKLGMEFVELCSLYLNSLELKTEAESVLRELSMRTTQTVYLATRQDTEIVYIDKMELYNSIRKYSIIGQRRPMYCTSLGKSFLMGMSNLEIRELLKDETFAPRTSKTITAMDQLITDVEMSRERGWAFDNEEWEDRIRCIGAPVFDYRGHTIAAISTVWYMNPNDDADIVEKTAGHIMEAAEEISKRMGFRNR